MHLSDYPSRPDGEDKGLHTEGPPRQKDLLRWTVHLLLTVYLLPAICLVILISLFAVLADGLARALVWLAHHPHVGWADDTRRTHKGGITNRPKRISPPGSARVFQPPQTMELARPERRSPIPSRQRAALPLNAVGIPSATGAVTRSRSPVPRPARAANAPPEMGHHPRAKVARRGPAGDSP